MKNLILNIFTIVIVLFIVLQVPISATNSKDFFQVMSKISWEKLIDGKYGVQLEQSFKENSYISKVSGEKYRTFIYGFFSRTNKNVIIGKDNFLFLRDKTEELDLKELNNIPRAISHLKEVQDLLLAHGIDLYIITIPARAKIYPELAYASKELPKNRKLFFDELLKTIEENGIKNLNLEVPMRNAKESIAPIPVFFKVDHHWSYKAVEAISPLIAAELSKVFLENKINRIKVYNYEWKIKTNAHNKIANKLGFPKASIPNKFKQQQFVPIFSPDKYLQDKNAENKLLIVSSSYARYGLVEFLSNEFGYRVPFYIERGRGPNYGMAKVFQRNINLSEKYGRPHTVLWVLSEAEIKNIYSDLAFTTIPNIEDLVPIEYKIKDVINAEKSGLKLSHEQNSLSFKIKTNTAQKKIVLALKVLSSSRTSKITIAGKKFEIIQDGEVNYFPVEFYKALDSIDVSIFTPPKASIEGKRTFEIIGVYK